MAKKRILYVVHNHPGIRPGGAEAYALELYHAMRASLDFEPFILSRTGPPMSQRRTHEGTLFASINEDPNQILFYTEDRDYDWVLGTSRGKHVLTDHYRRLLEILKPDVVHFQHTLLLGYDMVLQTRRTLPDAPIVYTLHEYLPICHRNGQMVRTRNNELCLEATPRRCNECFPEISPADFFMRKRYVQSHFAHVDRFVAPSRFLLERYVDWGIPREKIQYEEYGRLPLDAPIANPQRQARNRFGFFGQFSPFKGIDVLLKAVVLVASQAPEKRIHTWVHGANLDLQFPEFQEDFKNLLKAAGQYITFVGQYDHKRLGQLMANIDWAVVPSIWWENSPLVIQEAFQHKRPVICSDIGGMAEKVSNGFNGLHFRSNDPADLARAMLQAVDTPGLWDKLSSNTRAAYAMGDHVAQLETLYARLMSEKAGRSQARPATEATTARE
jgi:glycosyltransferase involved in cell wall biosynthesis